MEHEMIKAVYNYKEYGIPPTAKQIQELELIAKKNGYDVSNIYNCSSCLHNMILFLNDIINV